MSTTALVAAGLLVTSVAYAQDEEMAEEEMMMAEPVSVGVGGYYRVAIIGVDRDMPDADGDRGHSIQQNIEINLSGETTLDNGLTAGVNIWLDGNEGFQDDTSETRLYVSGGFGTFTFGQFESAAQLGTVWAPGGNGNFGVKSPWFGAGGTASWQGVIGKSEDDVTMMYASPTFGGVSISASYAPEDEKTSYADRKTAEGPYEDDDGNVTYDISETIGLSLNASMPMMGGSVSGGIGYETGTPEQCPAGMCDATSLRGGLVVTIDDVSIGGAIMETDIMGTTATHSDVGIGYSLGAMSLGVQYGNVDTDGADVDITAFNAAYNLGPGIEVNSQISTGSDGDGDWAQLMLGTAIVF
ncbi:MAG: porin [Rhodospirillaceae bacterium]|nr:porin [Rhodospirillaceae bacterium]